MTNIMPMPDYPLAPKDAKGRKLLAGTQVIIKSMPGWLTHDLPAEDQVRLKSLSGQVLTIAYFDRLGYAWFETTQATFCARPTDLEKA